MENRCALLTISAELAVGLLLCLALQKPVNAQSAAYAPRDLSAPRGAALSDGRVLEAILVTATKREESVQKIPIAVTSGLRGEKCHYERKTTDEVRKADRSRAYGPLMPDEYREVWTSRPTKNTAAQDLAALDIDLAAIIRAGAWKLNVSPSATGKWFFEILKLWSSELAITAIGIGANAVFNAGQRGVA
jgi:hypothetical protein